MIESGGVKLNGTDGGIAEQKRKCRSRMRARLAEFCRTADGGRRAAHSAVSAFLHSDLYRGADEIFAFAPTKCELDISEVVRRGLADKKRVAVPKVLSADGEMSAARMEFLYVPPAPEWESLLVPGAFGIREPDGSWARADCGFAARTVVLVPGLAFSPDGARLGRGKGYYDRYFSLFCQRAPQEARRVSFCGVGFSFQCSPDVPTDRHDLSMDWLLTDGGLFQCGCR